MKKTKVRFIKNKFYKFSGISLITLIITIIVIIILTGVIILSIFKNNIIMDANKATFINDVTIFKEHLIFYYSDKIIENTGKYAIKDVNMNTSETSITLNIASKYDGKFEIVNGELVYVGKNDQEKDWFKQIDGTTSDDKITKPFVNDGLETREYTDAAGRKAVIPKGFTVSEISSENVIEQGLVIYEGLTPVKTEKEHATALTTRSQYVWVPVDDGELNRTIYDSYDTTIYYDAIPQEILTSVSDNKGFYIARYEMSPYYDDIIGSRDAVSVKNGDSEYYINQYDAIEYSERYL